MIYLTVHTITCCRFSPELYEDIQQTEDIKVTEKERIMFNIYVPVCILMS